MKLLKDIKISFTILISFIAIGCSLKGDGMLQKGLDLYNSGQSAEGKKYIEEGLMSSSMITKIDKSNLLYGENIFYYREENLLKTIWPLKLSIECKENFNMVYYDPVSQRLGLCNGNDINVYDKNGKLIKTCGPAPDDNRIKTFIINNETLYYYKEHKIYVYDFSMDTEKPLSGDIFAPPFDKENFTVKFYLSNNILAATIGIAGKYRLYIRDYIKDSTTLFNQNIASSKIIIKSGDIFCIRGDSNKYYPVRIEIPSMKTTNLAEFSGLEDMEFSGIGIFSESRDGLLLDGYGEWKQKIPFDYKLAGRCGNNPVFKYAGELYVIDADKFLEKLSLIRERAPMVLE